jgi:hypothetical protein
MVPPPAELASRIACRSDSGISPLSAVVVTTNKLDSKVRSSSRSNTGFHVRGLFFVRSARQRFQEVFRMTPLATMRNDG